MSLCAKCQPGAGAAAGEALRRVKTNLLRPLFLLLVKIPAGLTDVTSSRNLDRASPTTLYLLSSVFSEIISVGSRDGTGNT